MMRSMIWPPDGSGPYMAPPTQARLSWAVSRDRGFRDGVIHHQLRLWRHRPCCDEIDWPPEIMVRRGVVAAPGAPQAPILSFRGPDAAAVKQEALDTVRSDPAFDYCIDWLVESLESLPVEWIETAPLNDLDVHDWIPTLLEPLDSSRVAWAIQCILNDLRTLTARRPRLSRLLRPLTGRHRRLPAAFPDWFTDRT